MLQQIDLSVLLWIQENLRADFMNGFWKAVTFLGNGGWFWIVLGAGMLFWKRTRPVGTAVLLALVIGAVITNLGLKNLVARIRPYDFSDQVRLLIAPQVDFSFPSGHSCASFAAATVCWKRLPRRYSIPAMVLAVMIAFSRLYVGVHYPSDVLGGVLIGIFAGAAACLISGKVMLRRNGA
ncbi:MAG: phosphatase PAP2 family protein [Lachnospiraceae bacterium]|nr:phosphatase PAP2 family protein [Lachnospiraceae bacterium]